MSTPSRYRARCAPIIARVLQESRGLPEAEVIRALLDRICRQPVDLQDVDACSGRLCAGGQVVR
jgi:hypothetical protein